MAHSEAQIIDELMPNDEDLLYEEELLRNPFSLRMWWRYIQARTNVSAKRRYILFERALRALPGSYKLWAAYLKERRLAVRGLRPDDPRLEALNNTYERALVSMHKMPRIWTDYLELLMEQHWVTRTRRTFDRALAALPITQHDRIWVIYLKFVRQEGIPVETAVRVYKRYLKLEPSHTEEYIAYLRAKNNWFEAARKLAEVLNDDTFRSLEGKSKHQMWLELADMITKHPQEVADMRVDAIIRGGIRKFTDEVGRLWIALADYYIRRGMFEKARDVYEEGLSTVITVRDFSLIFDALTTFEESLLTAKMEQLGEQEEENEDDGDDEDQGRDFLLKDDGNDVDLRLARLEHLMARRPELLSSVMLRQNPHNVHEWHKRAKLFKDNPTRQILTYTEAVKTVDVNKAVGKLHTLWCAFAKLYERHGDLPNARIIFEKAVQAPYKYVDDLASVYAEWAEMELRNQNFKRAMDTLKRATTEPPRTRLLSAEEERKLPVAQRVYKSLKLWTFLADLEESLGVLDSARAVYDRILELRIATPQIILNYALLLQEHNHWEDSFKVYERGIALFKFPHVRDVWTAYLTQFVDRYGGKKLERARDLFESALQMAPPAEAKPLFLQYAKLEEQYGLAKHAMEVYERACKTVPKKERMAVYDLYLARAQEFFGIAKVREIYEMAIESEPPYELGDEDLRNMCLRYAALERKLGEIDRARAVFVHASAMANPRVDRKFWLEWKAFEVGHGNEDTFREMLRIQRSVAASYALVHVDATTRAPEQGYETEPAAGVKRPRAESGDAMAALEEKVEPAAAPLSGFVSAGVIQQGQDKEKQQHQEEEEEQRQQTAAANPEEIDLDMDGDDDGEDEEGGGGGGERVSLRQKAVPSEVFGSLAAAAKQQQETGGEALGALERFKRQKVS